jgi:hypothetical protein
MKFHKFNDNLFFVKIKFFTGNRQPLCHASVTSPPRGRKVLIVKLVSSTKTEHSIQSTED